MPPARSVSALLLSALVIASPAPAARRAAPAAVQSPQTLDLPRRLDVHQLNMWTTNVGTLAWDLTTGASGLEFPKGSGKTAVFAGGLWIGARVGGQVRAVVAEYSQEYGPGPMSGAAPANPALPQFRVYKVLPWSGDPADTGHVDRVAPGPLEDPLAHDGWGEYVAGAVPYGAPVQTWLLPDPNNPGGTVAVQGPPDLGDQILWAVFNDADPANHTNDAGGSAPLGLEIQQTVLGSTHTAAAAHAAVIRYRIVNKGGQQLDDVIVSMWTDPDIGGPVDDLVGSDPALEMVYAYNASNADVQYGANPPAVAVVLLEGPRTASGDSIPARAAVKYINGTDPAHQEETYNYMQGLNADGSPIVDPLTNAVKTFVCDGDPVAGTGWVDTNPADRRMALSTGAFDMAPGETQDIVFAIVAGQGPDRLSSINVMRAHVSHLKSGVEPPPPPPTPTNCPRPLAFWATECAPASGTLAPGELGSIAAMAGARSLLFDWPAGNETSGFCAALAPPGPMDLRSQAKAEYAALLANWAAGQLGVVDGGGQPIRLLESMPVACPGVVAATLGQLVAAAIPAPFLSATYENDNPAHRRALTGVNWGGASFFGGADFAWVFGGVGPDPSAQPDSFVNVEVRFSHTATQKAYRYLRLEQAGGAAPAGGREYRYGGFREVPFQIWDIENGVQLDVAFVERAITDAAGTLQPPGAQPASFDSTWGPTSEDAGGREYLMVLTRPYSATPKAELAADGKFFDLDMPGMYALWPMLRSPGDVIDDGDRMLFLSAPYSGTGMDAQLLNLEGEPLAHPGVALAYTEIIECLRDINQGVTVENPCDQPTAIQMSLVSADANSDRVDLVWHTPSAGLNVTVERRTGADGWAAIGSAVADGTGMIRYSDGDVVAGGAYRYRVAFMDEGVLVRAGEAGVVVPSRLRLALPGFVPNPARGAAAIEFVLPARAPATLELLDLQGRRVFARDVGPLGPGRASVALEPTRPLSPGIYLIRLRQDGAEVSRKAVVVR